jgi:hypothetical protein
MRSSDGPGGGSWRSFLKAHDPKGLAAWYAANLGIARGADGSLVLDGPESAGMTVFAPFSARHGLFWGAVSRALW